MTKLMFLSVPYFCILWFIIIQLINLISGESSEFNNNTANDIPDWRSDRLERSVLRKVPLYLKISIGDGFGQRINLKWKKQPHSLANNNLPITLSNGYLIRKVMKELGEFVVYHDIAKCSAVIYFHKTRTLSGNVGLEFTITDLPYKFDRKGNYLGTIGFKYISRRLNPPLHNLPQIPDVDLNNLFTGCDRNPDNTNLDFYSEPGPSTSHRTKRHLQVKENYHQWRQVNSSEMDFSKQRRETPTVLKLYYLEVLVFVTGDVADMYKRHYGKDLLYIKSIAKDYIIYFNIIDMLFQKLATFYEQMQINIAKIVIEDGSEKLDVFTRDGELLFEDTVGKRRENLETQQILYPRDSYDYVFISTSRRIKANSIIVPGKTDYEADLYKARQLGRWFKAVPVTILGYFEYPVLAVHEIAQTFNIKLDPWNIETGIAGQCYAIMQQGSSKCPKCLKWSKESSEQFQLFFRENRNRCFLMNEPRSLRKQSVSQFFTLTRLCQCFGYDSVITNSETTFHYGYIPQENCNEPLPCAKIVDEQLIQEDTIAPFDGTLCGGRIKVCWNGWCTQITHA